MSGTPTAPASSPNVAETITTGLGHFFQAMDRGAALVYHDIVAVEKVVTDWTTSNPMVSAFIEEGVRAGTAFLEANGIPVPSIELAVTAVVSALRSMAAADTSVPSQPVETVSTTTSVAPAAT